MNRRKVVVTGAAGKVAGQVLPALRQRYDLVLLDVTQTNRQGVTNPDIQIANLTERNRDAYRTHFQGADAIVHFAFVGNSNPKASNDSDSRFWDEFANVQMAYNIYQTALEAGVRRVVVASSNHAADYYEPLILDHKLDVVDPNQRALSDNFYGWAKEVYEHLGFVFATGRQAVPMGQSLIDGQVSGGRKLEVVQIRIGGPRETDIETIPLGDLRRMRRALAVYISDRDMQQLFVKSIEVERIADEEGIPFHIFYGISGNSHAFWSIANALKILGYTPEDNSEIRFHGLIAKHIAAASSV